MQSEITQQNCSLLTSNDHFYMQSANCQVYCGLLTANQSLLHAKVWNLRSNYHLCMQSENFRVECSPIICFWMPKYEIWNVQVNKSLLYARSEIFKCNVGSTYRQLSLLHAKVCNLDNFQDVAEFCYWHPIITWKCNLKFSSVMFSTYRHLLLLHAKVCNLKFSRESVKRGIRNSGITE